MNNQFKIDKIYHSGTIDNNRRQSSHTNTSFKEIYSMNINRLSYIDMIEEYIKLISNAYDYSQTMKLYHFVMGMIEFAMKSSSLSPNDCSRLSCEAYEVKDKKVKELYN